MESTQFDNEVYNGVRKIVANNKMFMYRIDIINSIKNVKLKNCEGYDRIPQRVLVDGCEHLLDPVTKLVKLIYNEKAIPDQWRFAKIVPVHKKGK